MGDILRRYNRDWRVYVLALVKAIGVVAFFIAYYLLVAWVSISIAITMNGPIEWERGWEMVRETYLD